jgi:hypothetical protein
MATPPPLPSHVPRKNRTMTVIIAVMLALLLCLGVVIACLLVSFNSMAHYMSRQMQGIVEPHFAGSYADTFHMTFLQVEDKPHYLMEHIRVRCQNDMKVSIWVTDLKQVGIFEATDTNGAVFYREGHPHKAGSSVPVHADGGFSTCDILFRVTTTSTNTAWHDEVAGGTLDTTLPVPMTVSGVQTNWPGFYERGSDIPLANLGDCKILLSIK